MQYSNLKEFSLILMKGIKKFCHKTINETATDIDSTEKRNKRKKKKQNMEKEEFQKIKKTISRNKEAIKLVLKQRKFTYTINLILREINKHHKPQQYKTPCKDFKE